MQDRGLWHTEKMCSLREWAESIGGEGGLKYHLLLIKLRQKKNATELKADSKKAEENKDR